MFDAIRRIIIEKIRYIYKYDEFKRFLDDGFEMPHKLGAMLVRFLEQNNGTRSKRELLKEFFKLKEKGVKEIEKLYQDIFEFET